MSGGPRQAAGGDMVVLRDVMVVLRDGARLATDVYLPGRHGQAQPGPFPVILERTPYDKTATSRSERTAENATPLGRAEVAAYFVGHGYAVVYQDTRGRYRSEGRFAKYASEAADGYDTVVWLTRQAWCNGRVGTMGLSYAAHAQGALASLNPPGLAGIFLDCGGFSNAYQSGIRQGGAFELKQATWAHRNALADAKDPAVKSALGRIDLERWFARLPWTKGDSPVAAAPEYEAYLFELWRHGAFDTYWKQPGLWAEGLYDRYADVPMVHLSGWYDPYARTATENYVGLSGRKRSPVHLVMGPWTHGDRSLTYAGDVDFGAAATLDGNLAADFFALRLAWFDRWVKGDAGRRDGELPRVQIFVMGGGSGRKNRDGRLEHGGGWRRETDWPLPGTRYTRYHLHRDGVLAPAPPAEGAAPRAFRFDPRDPMPTIGGAISSGEPIMRGGAYDQRMTPGIFGARSPYRALAERPDVLVFQTPPLEADVEVTGPVTVRLWVASDAPDTDFTAKLVDVHPSGPDYPEGFAMNLTGGILRMRYRDSWEQPEPMAPGRVYAITIQAFPTSNRFVRGHRIRLDISSSNYPHFDVNPNTGEPEGEWTATRVATNTVFVDGARPSHVVLPIVDRDRS